MNCSISGQPAQEPVVSKNGDIFEKRLIVKHIEANGTCPITNEAMSLDDLIPIRLANTNAVKPRQLAATSIPGLLQTFQNEWDALMLETFQLKKQLETTRQELSQALYQSDAACRVIARTIKERDNARKELEQLRASVKGGARMDVESSLPGLDAQARDKLTAKAQELLTKRKAKDSAADTVATPEQIQSFHQLVSQTPHKASSPGILSVDLHPQDNDIVVTGGVDKTAVVFNRKTGRKEATLAGHGKSVTHTFFHPTKDVVFTGSSDSTVKIWTRDQEEYRIAHNISIHNDEITGISVHPTHEYLATCSADRTWGFHHIETGKSLLQVTEPQGSAITSLMLHPDGLILATGTADNGIRIWDLKTSKNVATFQQHKGAVTAVAFSENGFYLATAAKDNNVKLWDLRGPKNIQTVKLDTDIAALHYDPTGKYLAAATGSEVRIFTGKALDHVQTFDGHTNTVTGVRFGNDAKVLACVSMDRTVKLWGIQ